MSDKKQSSIEWFWNEVGNILPFSVDSATAIKLYNALQQAKAMHEKEIKDAVGVGSQFDRDYLYGYHDKAEQYYNETF